MMAVMDTMSMSSIAHMAAVAVHVNSTHAQVLHATTIALAIQDITMDIALAVFAIIRFLSVSVYEK